MLARRPAAHHRSGFLAPRQSALPVTGTTYMASDVHRRFLLEPNPSLWKRDFAAMAAAGVNLVRTGIWTGWKNLLAAGSASPRGGAARARGLSPHRPRPRHPGDLHRLRLPARILGRRQSLPRPACGAGPEALLGALARRYRAAHDVVWDLINEPSFSSAAQLWSTRPNYDAFENTAWRAWLAARLGTTTPSMLDAAVTAAWGTLPGEGARAAAARRLSRSPPVAVRSAREGARLQAVRPGDVHALGHRDDRRDSRGRRREAVGHRRPGRRRHRGAPGPAVPRRSARFHVDPQLVAQRHAPLGRRHDTAAGSSAPGGRDRPDDVRAAAWRVVARRRTRPRPAGTEARHRDGRRRGRVSCSGFGTPTSTCPSTTRRA